MTCIIGYVDDEQNIWFGADGRMVSNEFILQDKNSKIFQIDRLMIGMAGSHRIGQIVENFLELPKDVRTKPIEYIIKDFIVELRRILLENSYSVEELKESYPTFIVGYQGEIFYISYDFSVTHANNNFASIGSGYEIATGAFWALKKSTELEISEIMFKTLEIASEFISSVGKPFSVESMNIFGILKSWELQNE